MGHASLITQVFARKLILLSAELDDQMVAIENELRFITKLRKEGSNANIVSVFRHGEVRRMSRYYIDMELCDGNLCQFMRDNGRTSNTPINMKQVWSIMAQIADAVAYIHSQGEVHRDIKPNNSKIPALEVALTIVLYSKQDRLWKITDFGLTREGTS